MYITHFWGAVDWARVATRYAEASGEVVPDRLPSPDRYILPRLVKTKHITGKIDNDYVTVDYQLNVR